MVNHGTPTLNGQRFLIAEDEFIIAMLLEDMVERCGGTVVATAKSCDEVFEALGMYAIDALILDVHLHGGTREDIVAIAKLKEILILVCTGSDPRTLGPAFRDLPVLQKPWQSKVVDQALVQLLA